MTLEDIRRCHEQATRRWTGCDWPTRFGKAGLNLQGCTAQEAEARANAPGEPRDDWLAASHWLRQIEQCADRAETQAALALAAANAGDLRCALQHAESACAIEQATGRVEATRSSVWGDFRRAIASTIHETPSGPHFLHHADRGPQLAAELRALARQLEQIALRLEKLDSRQEASPRPM